MCTFTFPPVRLPKDGPSAGVTMFTSLVSMLTGISGSSRRGDGLAKSHYEGACFPLVESRRRFWRLTVRAIRRLVLPERNKADLEEVPREILTSSSSFFTQRDGPGA